MLAVAILKRRLCEGKTYTDFRKAWFHTEGFGTPTRMFTMLNIADPREIIVIGILEVTSLEGAAKLISLDQQQRGARPLDDIIEPSVERTVAALVAEDDFSPAGTLDYCDPTIEGQPVDLAGLQLELELARQILSSFLTPPPHVPPPSA
jgi:hypothetical protein